MKLSGKIFKFQISKRPMWWPMISPMAKHPIQSIHIRQKDLNWNLVNRMGWQHQYCLREWSMKPLMELVEKQRKLRPASPMVSWRIATISQIFIKHRMHDWFRIYNQISCLIFIFISNCCIVVHWMAAIRIWDWKLLDLCKVKTIIMWITTSKSKRRSQSVWKQTNKKSLISLVRQHH